jgi:hypothetical protein
MENKILKFVTSDSVVNYVAVDELDHFSTTATTVVVHIVGKGSINNETNWDTITITLATAAQAQACADKLAQVMTAVNVTKATPIVVDTSFSAGISGIEYESH